MPDINELQRNINNGNIVALKKHIRGIISRMEATGPNATERIEKFKEILR